MSKARTRDIASAVQQANDVQPPSQGQLVVKQLAEDVAAATEPTPPAAPPRRRRHREGQRGVLIYLSPAAHKSLKRRAIDADMSLQDLCATAVLRMLDTPLDEPLDE